MKLTSSIKTRLNLFGGSALTLFIVAVFLVIMNINEPREYTEVPFSVLAILVVIACVSLAVFFAKGPVFDIEGNLESVNINAMLITVLIIIQVSFFFEIVSVRNQILNYELYEDIRNDITEIDNSREDELEQLLVDCCVDGIAKIAIVDNINIVLVSSEKSEVGTIMAVTPHSYDFGKNREIRFVVDKSFIMNELKSIVLNLLTVLVTSIFFSIEIILLVIRIITRRLEKESLQTLSEDDLLLTPLYYIRQIAFLFYFASRLSSAFIPIMAKTLQSPIPAMYDAAAAGLPQTAETLFTCAAIFITTIILEKKGWKLPFLAGLIMVAGGTFLSAFALNLPIFILARAVVGLGYGFCWMTLRNLSLFGRDNKETLLGFALLNAGIYAGMNCGASLGAILADIFGFKIVFVISAILTLLTSVFIIRMENAILSHSKQKKEENTEKETLPPPTAPQVISAALFVILMIAPASIAASYLSYYLPLYYEAIGRSVTDVGRAQLLYGIVIVYVGPFLSVFIASFRQRALKNINFIYNIMIALSLFLPGIGAGLLMSYLGSALLGSADSFGFGVQNNYFLGLPAVKRLGASKSLSVLSFIKKILEMAGPIVFAVVIMIGFRQGIKAMAGAFAAMAVAFMVLTFFSDRVVKEAK